MATVDETRERSACWLSSAGMRSTWEDSCPPARGRSGVGPVAEVRPRGGSRLTDRTRCRSSSRCSPLRRFLAQFTSYMQLILVGGGVVCSRIKQWTTAIVLAVISALQRLTSSPGGTAAERNEMRCSRR